MKSVEERVGELVEEHLGISDRALLDSDVGELGLNSMQAVEFIQAVNQEFGDKISPDDASGFTSLRDLIGHLGG